MSGGTMVRGFPFTPIRGYYEQQTFTDGLGQPNMDYPYTTENGQMGILYGDLNSQRLPAYPPPGCDRQEELASQ